MLKDMERKMLRILYNYLSGRKRLPSIEELAIKTGKDKKEVHSLLLSLERQEYIRWEDKSSTKSIMILEIWERDRKVIEPTPSSDIRYWTEY